MKKILVGIFIYFGVVLAIIATMGIIAVIERFEDGKWPGYVEYFINDNNTTQEIAKQEIPETVLDTPPAMGVKSAYTGQIDILLENEYVFGCIVVALCVILGIGFYRTTKQYLFLADADYAIHPDHETPVKMPYSDYLLTTIAAALFLVWVLIVKSPVVAFDVLMPSSDDGWISTVIGAFFICIPGGIFGISAWYLWKTQYYSQRTQVVICVAVLGIASAVWSLLMFMVYTPWLIWITVGESYLLAYVPFSRTRRQIDERARQIAEAEAARQRAHEQWMMEHPDICDYDGGGSVSTYEEPEDYTPRRPRIVYKSYVDTYEENSDDWTASNECYFYKDGDCHFWDHFHTDAHLEPCDYDMHCTRCPRFRRGGHQW